MRIAGPDVVLFVVGLVLFSGAGYALVETGGLGASATGIYDVRYASADVELASGTIASYQSASVPFTLDRVGLASLTIALTCTDTVPGGTYNYQVQVEPPAGSNVTVDPVGGACNGERLIEVPLSTPPNATATLQADSLDEANARAAQWETDTSYRGEWTVTIAGARGGAGPIPGLPAAPPAGSLVVTGKAWNATVAASSLR